MKTMAKPGKGDKVNISKLKFDSENPRLPFSFQGETDEKKIIEYMIMAENVVELMGSIAELGYSDAEPLLVVKNEAGDYTVVEGNRRLAALKILNNPDVSDLKERIVSEIVSQANVIPTNIPVVIYGKREDILNYLGYRHITGIKDWGALQKAAYLDSLYNAHIQNSGEKIYSQLAKMIGSRADYVRKLHMAYKLYQIANDNAFYGIETTPNRFSWITVALGHISIKKYLGIDNEFDIANLNKENYKKLFIWLFDEKKKLLKESRNITELATVLGSEKSIQKLEEGNSLKEALLFSGESERSFVDLLIEARENLSEANQTISKLSYLPVASTEVLKEISRLMKGVQGALNSTFGGENAADDVDMEMFKKFKDFMGKNK